jgi:hypothetical protein
VNTNNNDQIGGKTSNGVENLNPVLDPPSSSSSSSASSTSSTLSTSTSLNFNQLSSNLTLDQINDKYWRSTRPLELYYVINAEATPSTTNNTTTDNGNLN